jgi:hypothetical protein
MATTTSRTTTARRTTSTTGTGKSPWTRKTEELLIVTRNDENTLARLTNPLSRNSISIECFTSYKWGEESAVRIVTDNNRKARELLRSAGYAVQENPVVLWYTRNEPGCITKAATALANAHINTFCSYSTGLPDSGNAVVAFDTNDANRTLEVLTNLR